MDIARIPGATRTIGESQGYLGLPLRDEPVHCTVNGPATPSMVTAWLPTPDEVAALMAGAAVHVRILGTAHPPIMLGVGPSGEGEGDAPAPAAPVSPPAESGESKLREALHAFVRIGEGAHWETGPEQCAEAMRLARAALASTPAPQPDHVADAGKMIDPQPGAEEDCQNCAGNGEIVTDWDRYLKAHPGDVGDEAVAECPECSGTGKVAAAPQPGGADTRPANCRFRLEDEGKPHPKSGCEVSGCRGVFGALCRAALSPSPSGWDAGAEALTAWQDVLAERQRQITSEGWTPEHDDKHSGGELARAAACYAAHASAYQRMPVGLKTYQMIAPAIREYGWPFEIPWWKPSNPRRDLVKAAALVLAEIERMDRLSPPAREG
ncbi:hypothetical protein [Xanthobacter sp.]|uniref:hypothetical protein n=1 Tax=Xanthobacter sp. TaxID=35809 RepID=UPI0025FF3CB0|nr:hypothetical protein [Xanthobacter sp.]